MAQSTLHFALGMIAGTAMSFPPLLRARLAGAKLSRHFTGWFLLAYGLGIYAIVPSLLRRAGVPDAVCDGWWMNLFLFHPLLDRLKDGGILLGEILVASGFILQYSLLLAAISRCHRKAHPDPNG